MSSNLIIPNIGLQKPIRGVHVNLNHPLARGLLAAWIFNEGAGDVINSYTSASYAGRIYSEGGGYPKWHPDGIEIVSDAAQERYIEIPDNPKTPASFTVVWEAKFIKDDEVSRVMSRHDGADYGWILTRLDGNDSIEFYRSTDGDDWAGFESDPNSCPANEWAKWAFVYEPTLQAIYKNGKAIKTSALTGSPFNSANQYMLLFQDWRSCELNREQYNFDGICKYIQFYNAALSASQVALLSREPYCMFQQPVLYVVGTAGAPAPIDLTIQNAIHGQISDVVQNIRLRGNLIVQGSLHDHLADVITPTVGATHTLTVQGSIHSQLANITVLNRSRTLSAQDSIHGQLCSTVGLDRSRILNARDTLHGHVANVLALPRLRSATVQSSIHGNIADVSLLSKVVLLQLQSVVHGHTADVVSPSRSRTMSVRNTIHASLADILTLAVSGVQNLTLQSSVHGSLSDVVSLSRQRNLTLQEPIHAHITDSITLSALRQLLLQSSLHSHLADVSNLSKTRLLSLQDPIHGHIVDILTLTAAGAAQTLTLQEPLHGSFADVVHNIRSRILLTQNTIHGQVASVFALSRFVGRIYPHQTWIANTTAFDFIGSDKFYNSTANSDAFAFIAKEDK